MLGSPTSQRAAVRLLAYRDWILPELWLPGLNSTRHWRMSCLLPALATLEASLSLGGLNYEVCIGCLQT